MELELELDVSRRGGIRPKGGYTVDRRIETRSNGGVGDLIKREKLSFSLDPYPPIEAELSCLAEAKTRVAEGWRETWGKPSDIAG